jgi:hypothetical protein
VLAGRFQNPRERQDNLPRDGQVCFVLNVN